MLWLSNDRILIYGTDKQQKSDADIVTNLSFIWNENFLVFCGIETTVSIRYEFHIIVGSFKPLLPLETTLFYKHHLNKHRKPQVWSKIKQKHHPSLKTFFNLVIEVTDNKWSLITMTLVVHPGHRTTNLLASIWRANQLGYTGLYSLIG